MEPFILGGMQSWQWALVVMASLLIGMSRTVYSGLAMIFVPLMAAAFGGRASLGVILPLLCFGDLFAITWYRRQADFGKLLRLAPWTLVGMAVGLAIGTAIPDLLFKRIMALIVLVCLALMLRQDRRGSTGSAPAAPSASSAPSTSAAPWVPVVSGFSAGVATMIGNAAGPIMSIYLLSMGLDKKSFIGTAAWFFLSVNLIKLPLQAFFWNNMTRDTLRLDLILFPLVAAGALIGLKIADRIPERGFRPFVYVVSAVSGIILLL